MQIIRCKSCGAEIARVDTATREVYEIRAGDERPRQRVDDKGRPVDRGRLMKVQPAFHLDDRLAVVTEVEGKEKGTTEEVTTLEPMTVTCGCGETNPVY